MTTLRDGTATLDPRLDRLVEFDTESRRYGVMAVIEHLWPRSWSWRCYSHLDQGQEGACVEYAWVHEMLSSPVAVERRIGEAIVALHAIYWPAQRNDPWPGGSYPGAQPRYEGTSVLAGAKRARALGYIDGYRWAFGIQQTIMAIAWEGPVVFGLVWREQMFTPDANGWIRAAGADVGGHSLLGKAVRLVWLKGTTTAQKRSPQWYGHLDLDRSYVTLHQSWGEDHGLGGDVRISVRDLAELLTHDGEVCVPVGRRRTSTVPLTNA